MLIYLLLACPGPETDTSAKPDDTAVDTDTGTDTDTDTGDGLDPATVPLEGVCELADDFGGFTVAMSEDETTVDGTVADGVVPTAVLEELAADGDCRVLRRNNPFCDPGCDPGYTCDFDGECVPYPANQDLGTVSIVGMVQPVEMEPVFPGNTYYDTSLPHPGFIAGELLTLLMPGGVYGPAELHGVGIEPLVLPAGTWTLDEGQDFTLTWDPPVGPVVRSEVYVVIAIDQHGVSPSTLQCVFADDGEGIVSASIVSALIDVGVTGFPSGTMTRRTADHAAAGEGCFDFVVSSSQDADVEVVGHTPCISDEDCPEGQDCNEELQTCQ